MFARGTDDALWEVRGEFLPDKVATWGDWIRHGGTLKSDPAAVDHYPRARVFAEGSDRALWWGEIPY